MSIGLSNDSERLSALKGYGVLDTPNEPPFDAIVREAARAFDAPIVLISLIDEDRQWFKAKVGLEPDQTPRSISFCTHTLRGSDVLVVGNALEDERFATNPLVTGDPHIRFYAGAPLKTPDGKRIGTICVIDSKPRAGLSSANRNDLEGFAQRTIAALELRKAAKRR